MHCTYRKVSTCIIEKKSPSRQSHVTPTAAPVLIQPPFLAPPPSLGSRQIPSRPIPLSPASRGESPRALGVDNLGGLGHGDLHGSSRLGHGRGLGSDAGAATRGSVPLKLVFAVLDLVRGDLAVTAVELVNDAHTGAGSSGSGSRKGHGDGAGSDGLGGSDGRRGNGRGARNVDGAVGHVLLEDGLALPLAGDGAVAVVFVARASEGKGGEDEEGEETGKHCCVWLWLWVM